MLKHSLLFKSVIGAENYNLKKEDEKPYYKIFVNPSFDDLYTNKTISDRNSLSLNEDKSYSYDDIRVLAKSLVKPNIYFIEALYSGSITINENLDTKSKDLINKLLENKDIISKINLSHLYDSCIGIFKSRYTKALKNLSNNIYGYNTEEAFECWRILDFLRAYADSNFNNFKGALWYEESNNKRKFLIDLRNGLFSLNEFKQIINDTFTNIKNDFEEKYKKFEFDKETAIFVEDIAKDLFYINLRNMPRFSLETTY